MLIIGIAIVVVVVAVAVGWVIGGLGDRSVQRQPDPPRVSEDCKGACSLFQIRRQNECLAKESAEVAKAHADAMRSTAIAIGVASLGPVGVVIAAIITASIAATVASGGTLAPATIAAIVLAIAIAALAVLIFFPLVVAMITAAVKAAIVASNKHQAALDAAAATNQARTGVLEHCPKDEADACLNTPIHC